MKLFHPALGLYVVHIKSKGDIIKRRATHLLSVAEHHAQKVIKEPLLLRRSLFDIVVKKLLVHALPASVELCRSHVRVHVVLLGDDTLNLGLCEFCFLFFDRTLLSRWTLFFFVVVVFDVG